MATSPLAAGRNRPEKTRFPERRGFPQFTANPFESREFRDIAGGARRGDNPQYQLIKAEYPASPPFNGEIHSWTYDAIGNRLTNTVNTTTQNYAYLKNGQNPLNGQKLANDGANAYAYDFNGNTLTRTGYGFAYDAENRLTAITGNETASYTYDYQGRRTSKTVAGVTTNYLYDGLNLIDETAGGQTSYFLNGTGIDEPLATSKAGAVSYFSVDGLGSVVATNDPAGTVSHSAVFDAWGNTKSEVRTRRHPFTYTGRETGEAGTLFYRARYYQPGIGRMLLEDPLGNADGPSLFAYTANNPTSHTDSLGLFREGQVICRKRPDMGPGYAGADIAIVIKDAKGERNKTLDSGVIIASFGPNRDASEGKCGYVFRGPALSFSGKYGSKPTTDPYYMNTRVTGLPIYARREARDANLEATIDRRIREWKLMEMCYPDDAQCSDFVFYVLTGRVQTTSADDFCKLDPGLMKSLALK